MKRRRRRNSRRNNWISIFFIFIFFTGLSVLFYPEIRAIWDFSLSILDYFEGNRIGKDIINLEFLKTLFMIASALILYHLFLIVFSQFLLPSSNWIVRKHAYQYLRLFNKRKHGSVLKTYDQSGQISKRDILLEHPTIALVDLSSAIVVKRKKKNEPDETGKVSKNKAYVNSPPDLLVPGVNFLQKGDVIHEFIDLRPQIREANGVVVETWEKIKLTTDIQVIFSIGKPSKEIILAFDQNDEPEFKVIILSDQHYSAGSASNRFISEILTADQINPDDYKEALSFYRRWGASYQLRSLPVVEAKRTDGLFTSPYSYEKSRLQSAASLDLTSTSPEKSVNWKELPLQIAIDTLRTRMAMTKYDDLYSMAEPAKKPLDEFKKTFSRDVQNQGLLVFRLAQKRNRESFKIGDLWDESELILSEQQRFTYSNVLRNHGIGVEEAGFSELIPEDDVRNKLVGYWQAKLKKESDIRKADTVFEINQLKSNLRNEAKRIIPDLPLINAGYISQDQEIEHIIKYLNGSMSIPEIRNSLPKENQNKIWELRKFLLSIKSEGGRIGDSDNGNQYPIPPIEDL